MEEAANEVNSKKTEVRSKKSEVGNKMGLHPAASSTEWKKPTIAERIGERTRDYNRLWSAAFRHFAHDADAGCRWPLDSYRRRARGRRGQSSRLLRMGTDQAAAAGTKLHR